MYIVKVKLGNRDLDNGVQAKELHKIKAPPVAGRLVGQISIKPIFLLASARGTPDSKKANNSRICC